MVFKQKEYKEIVVFVAITAIAFSLALMVIPSIFSVSYSTLVHKAEVKAAVSHDSVIAPQDTASTTLVVHKSTPQAVKAIYISACAASTPSFRERLLHLVDTTELNAVIVDVKDFSGTISFPTDNPVLAKVKGPGCRVKDMKQFITKLHDKNIYVIARITVFQDPYYSKIHPELAVKTVSGDVWKDRKGLSFIDVGAKPFWDYMVELSNESYKIGFDEINFDYIRYPSDGNISDAVFTLSVEKGQTKSEALEKFFAHLDTKLRASNIPISADLFGMTTTSTDDMGIGQILEDALRHFDFVAPMVYPSHYPAGFNGWSNVNAPTVVGPLIKFVMDSGVVRTKALAQKIASSTPSDPSLKRINPLQLRPWLQGGNYPVTYTSEMVRAQIQGTYDAGLTSWMLWDAGNKYTPSALLPE